ncbi:glycosyltransferase family 2 protein [Azospirillum sp.]|uniref:glycosyltransferase family 2 protein n=1 Tax=Azospirillum sp. TaxID=34012 RepID=UPI003D70E756
MTPRCRIIIVSHNCADYLNRCLAALLAQTATDFEVVVVDNASQDLDRVAMPDDARFTLVALSENVGFAAGNNLGARGAQAPWLVTLNPDAFPEPDWLERLHAAAAANPGVAMFGSTQLSAADPSLLDGEGDRYSIFGLAWRAGCGRAGRRPYFTGEVFSPCAAAAMYRRALFEEVGGFDERFFCYCEDIDLGFRMRLRGARCLQVGDAVVHHVGSGVSKRYGDFSLYHGIRNIVWTLIKNVPFPLIVLVVPLHAAAMGYFALFRWRWSNPGTAERAMRDAIGGLPEVLRQRRAIQASRNVTLAALMRVITWSPMAVKRRL